MQRKRIGMIMAGGLAALTLTATTSPPLYAQDRADTAERAKGRGTYHEARMADLPGPAQRAIQKYARGADEVQVWRVTREGDEDMYEAAFPNKQGVRSVMKVDKTGAVVVPPTELPEDQQNAKGQLDIRHVEYEDLPRAPRQALGKEAEGASEVDYMIATPAEGGAESYIVHYTPKDGQRMQLWANANGKITSGPKPTRYQPEDRGDERARNRERERNRQARNQENGGGEAQPAAARSGRGMRVYPLDPDQVPSAVERTFRQEADQNWDRAAEASVFRVGENDYVLQFERDKSRKGMRVDRSGKVVAPLADIDRQDRNPGEPEREYFDPIERGEVPKRVSDQFEKTVETPLDQARNVKFFRVGEDDYLFRYGQDGRAMAVRIDRQGQVTAPPYEIPDPREDRDR